MFGEGRLRPVEAGTQRPWKRGVVRKWEPVGCLRGGHLDGPPRLLRFGTGSSLMSQPPSCSRWGLALFLRPLESTEIGIGSPLLREGVSAHQENIAKRPLKAQTGWSSGRTTPSAPVRNGILFDVAAT